MGSDSGKKKIKLNKTTTSILLTFAAIVVGGIIFKAIADTQSNSRIDF